LDSSSTRSEQRLRSQARSKSALSASAASFLSFLWPGVGQLYARQILRGLVFALPPLVLTVVLLLTLLTAADALALRLLVPSFALGMVLLVAIHAVWRVIAIVDAWLVTRRKALSRDRAAPLVVLLSAVVIGTHALAGLYIQTISAAGEQIGGNRPGSGPLDDLLDSGPRGPIGGPIPTDGPINVLFVGIDSSPTRGQALTDSLIVASFDRQRDQIAMISVPRDTGRLPMYDGTVYNRRVNSLFSVARRDPERFPDGPIGTLVKEMSYIVGVDIHYYAIVDMAGFTNAVDAVDGVDVVVDKQIADPVRKLYLDPGRYHLDGEQALSYVRSRFGPNNSDYQRARRQQQVLRALAKRASDPAVFVRLPSVVDAVAQMVRSNAPLEQLPELLDVLQASESSTTRQIVLSPKKYAQRIPPAEVGGRFMTELKMDALAELSIELFGDYSRYAQAGGP
jgi:polyisoprenyl-teichoic acid--peptidoglycan teichoic acid transferase